MLIFFMHRYKNILISLYFINASASALEYSKQYDHCIDNSNGITSVMLNCESDEMEKQEKLLNANYKKVMVTLNQEKKLELKRSQQLWLKYRDAKCGFFYGLSGGTVDLLNSSSCFLEMIAIRAYELSNLVEED